ncbi:MAG TPA: ABC transporter permease [Candidatus Saccharimonadales bacterium]|nr:ABC transporter permease [Candidatus Saccharimonadales bacterium]
MNYVHKIKARYRYASILLRQMVATDFKLRYQGSTLGYVWSLLRPLFLFVILYVVFVRFLRIGSDIPHYPVYLLMGIVLWNFFAEITSNSVSAVVQQRDLIRKLNFPKYVIFLSVGASALINLLLNTVVITIFLAINHVPFGWSDMWFVLFSGELFVFALALGTILGTVFVRLRDINYIWEVIAQALFYATPIIYPLQLVLASWPAVAKVLLLNPIAQSIQDIRYNVVTPQTKTLAGLSHHWYVVAVPFVLVVVVSVLALNIFKRRAPHFAEEV